LPGNEYNRRHFVKTHVTGSSAESVLDLSLPAVGPSRTADDTEAHVLALFDRHAPRLLHYVGTLGVSALDAEDVVQETFLALFRHLRLGRDQTQIAGWLFRVARNLALKRLRTARRRPLLAAEIDALTALAIDPGPDPEARIVEDERRQRLRAVVRALPARDRRCVLLRAEGLTYRDIAVALGLSLGSVGKSLARAMTRLMSADGG